LESGLRNNGNAHASGAQTERWGGAGEGLLGGEASQATWLNAVPYSL
jgi:hypothetical protein